MEIKLRKIPKIAWKAFFLFGKSKSRHFKNFPPQKRPIITKQTHLRYFLTLRFTPSHSTVSTPYYPLLIGLGRLCQGETRQGTWQGLLDEFLRFLLNLLIIQPKLRRQCISSVVPPIPTRGAPRPAQTSRAGAVVRHAVLLLLSVQLLEPAALSLQLHAFKLLQLAFFFVPL